MEKVIDKRINFKGIAGLKVLAAVFMFLWHSPVPNPPIDLGARLCEFFFVTSGFLFYISNARKTDSLTSSTVISYMRRKFVRMWPVHFVGFIVAVWLLPTDQLLLPETKINAVLNLTLLQSWVNNDYVFFGFNGVSWYLSSLFFSYCMGFFLLKLIQNTKKIILFVVLFVIRYVLEAIPNEFPGIFWTINIHVSPFARALEFGMGMIAGSAFLNMGFPKIDRMSFAAASWLEVASLTLVIIIMIRMEGIWLRASYIIPFCILVVCFAFDNGVLSKILSIKPIQWLSKFQLEIYMFHQLCFRCLEYKYPLNTQMVIYTCALAVVIIIYRKLIQRPMECLLERLLKT